MYRPNNKNNNNKKNTLVYLKNIYFNESIAKSSQTKYCYSK